MNYIIIDTPLLKGLHQKNLLSAKITTRKSVDGLKALVKTKNDTPESISSFPKYTHDEILQLMESEAWASVDEGSVSDV